MSEELRNAFFEVCKNAEEPESHWLSLYVRVPYYGGPEEGGWWGNDVDLIASHHFDTKAKAEAAKAAIEQLVVELNKQAKDDFGRQCLAEMEWCEARGLDADYLPEPDGEVSYFVTYEDKQGSQISRGIRHYE